MKYKKMNTMWLLFLIAFNTYLILINTFESVNYIRIFNKEILKQHIDNVFIECFIVAILYMIILLLSFIFINDFINKDHICKSIKDYIRIITKFIVILIATFSVCEPLFVLRKMIFQDNYDRAWPLVMAGVIVLTSFEYILNHKRNKY